MGLRVESCRALKAPCARKISSVVIYWAAKSHKMSLNTLLYSYQSMSYFSPNLSVTCLSFPLLRESKFPLAGKALRSLSHLLNSFLVGRPVSPTGRGCSSTDVQALAAQEFSDPAVRQMVFKLLSVATAASGLQKAFHGVHFLCDIRECCALCTCSVMCLSSCLLRCYSVQTAQRSSVMPFYGPREAGCHCVFELRGGDARRTSVFIPSEFFGICAPTLNNPSGLFVLFIVALQHTPMRFTRLGFRERCSFQQINLSLMFSTAIVLSRQCILAHSALWNLSDSLEKQTNNLCGGNLFDKCDLFHWQMLGHISKHWLLN